jgi:hypothetical protein
MPRAQFARMCEKARQRPLSIRRLPQLRAATRAGLSGALLGVRDTPDAAEFYPPIAEFYEECRERGVLVAADPLHKPEAARAGRADGGRRRVSRSTVRGRGGAS